MAHIEPEAVMVGERPVTADQLVAACGKRLGRLFPDHQLERIAILVGAHAIEIFTAAHLGAAAAAGFGAGGGQGGAWVSGAG